GFRNINPRGHGFFWFYFINEHFLRYLGKRYPVDYDKVPLFIFYGLHFLWLFPWSIYLPLFRWRWRRQAEPQTAASGVTATNSLLLIWPAIIILFFTFSTRQEYYTLPALPALAILIARRLSMAESEATDTAARRWLRWSRAGFFAFSI